MKIIQFSAESGTPVAQFDSLQAAAEALVLETASSRTTMMTMTTEEPHDKSNAEDGIRSVLCGENASYAGYYYHNADDLETLPSFPILPNPLRRSLGCGSTSTRNNIKTEADDTDDNQKKGKGNVKIIVLHSKSLATSIAGSAG